MGKYQELINGLFAGGKFQKENYAALVKSTDRATGPLIAALIEHDDPEVRETCAEILNERKSVNAIPALISALSDDNINVRQDALWAIENISGYQAGMLQTWLNIKNTDSAQKLHKRVSEWWNLNKKYIQKI